METLTVKLKPLDEKAMLSAAARSNPEIVIDYSPPTGTGKGYSSLELLLLSFASCLSTTVASLLRYRMKKQVYGISAEARGVLREKHPKALSSIAVMLSINAPDLSEADVREALRAAEDKICPVWSMIKGNVEVEVTFSLSPDSI